MQGQVSLAKDDADALYQQVSPAWSRAAQYVHEKGGFGPKLLREEPVRSAIEATATVLGKAVDYGIKGLKPSDALVSRLKSDVFYFSGMKTYHSLKEAAGALLDETGKLKSWYNFSRDIAKIDSDYNRAYLQAEHQFAIGSSQMAAKWQESEADGDRYNLQYRTAGDDHVRESHRALQGVTLPPSDPFWDEFYPPNGWRCRCTVVQVRKEKYEQSRSIDAIESGRKATSGKFEKMFRYNPGKSQTVFPPHHPYSTSKCTSCAKRANLASDNSELCRVCKELRDSAESWKTELMHTTSDGNTVIAYVVEKNKKDFQKRLAAGIELAKHYKDDVVITPNIHYTNPLYDTLYGSLKDTIYWKKCPDGRVGATKHFELEGYTAQDEYDGLCNMIAHGSKQSNLLVIEKCCTKETILRVLNRHNKHGQYPVNELWTIDESMIMDLLFRQK